MSDKKFIIYGAILISGLLLAWLTKSLQPVEKTAQENIKFPVSSGSKTVASSVKDNQVVFGELVVYIPFGWKIEQPSSTMRIGQFELPGSSVGKGSAELSVFSNIGGSIEANLNRWFDQFQQPDGVPSKDRAVIDRKSRNEMEITIADVSGTFMGSDMSMSQQLNRQNFRLLAAIVQAPQNTYYFKLVGPTETISHWYESFNNFISGIQRLN